MTLCEEFHAYCRKSVVDTAEVSICFDDALKPGESLSSVTWFHSDGVDVEADLGTSGSIVKARVSGGTAANTYTVAAEIESNEGQRIRRAAMVSVFDCS